MSSLSEYRSVKIERKSLTDQLKNKTQHEWAKACERLGLFVPLGYGKGSHIGVYKSNVCPPSNCECCVVTIPMNIYPQFQKDLFKKILFHGIVEEKYGEDDVWRALKML